METSLNILAILLGSLWVACAGLTGVAVVGVVVGLVVAGFGAAV